jgi:hypothetical protein
LDQDLSIETVIMPTRQLHYYIYSASDIHSDSIVLEVFQYSDQYMEHEIPLLYVSRNCENAARMLEESTKYQEETHRIGRMERLTDYFFQIQKQRLSSLEPINSGAKWSTFKRVVEAYNLGDIGVCSYLGDYLNEKGLYLLDKVHSTKGTQNIEKLKLPGNEKFVADLINRINQ